ncbi:anti-sigma factor antagonist [Photobacterium gaetbulicola]|uniref:Anti-sigma factor antagonist n=2 Tax=Photobacterium gaetbulicola TaxID=1295392 RepID=A0A0C5WMG1_9GAMM|nr:STAS domain-containing protein [Photobacterium gaetbulicola]AJR08303.1 anti-sigma-factor antagonist [Photobacterium gaetbulicola Gung47]KHT63325.1 anti-sigma factor antagonist [Photobacterium gaetbulicola]PSU09021.1 anti-sigma factor antagonist [Photobacterium gaetbulicola]
MRYETFHQGQCTILQIKEERFDAKLAPSFREEVEKLSSGIGGHLVLDLSEVRFMDSSGLGAVMAVYKMLRGKKISVVNPQRAVKELLKLTRMDKLITSFDTIEDAVATMA